MAKCYPAVGPEYQKQVDMAKMKLRGLITDNLTARRILLLSMESAQIYWTVTKNKGGRFVVFNPLVEVAPEMPWFHNYYVNTIRHLNGIKCMFPVLSHADFYQLAGIVALERIGGPDVPFHAGRKDFYEPPGQDRLSIVCDEEKGLTKQDIAALSGAANLGDHDATFGNSYFKELLTGEEEGLLARLYKAPLRSIKELWSGEKVGTLGKKIGLIQLPSDEELLDDPVFRPLVEKYAADESAFVADYIKAHLKLSELGFADA